MPEQVGPSASSAASSICLSVKINLVALACSQSLGAGYAWSHQSIKKPLSAQALSLAGGTA